MREIPNEILAKNKKLQNHPMYKELNDLKSLQNFMEYHVFAVWDFMSLLKSLQRSITCVNVPWSPSIYSQESVRMINQIVLGEESDIDQNGKAQSHFQLYLNAMSEIGANTQPILNFIKTFNTSELPNGAKEFVDFNLDIALNAPLHKVAGAFLFGREKVIPDMFQGILNYLQTNQLNCPTLIYYLERHIQLDGDEHSHLALACLESICGNDDSKWIDAIETGIKSLDQRTLLWNEVQVKISP
jgi:hypothetical protein